MSNLFDIKRADELPRRVEIRWLWRDLIAAGTVAMLGGAGGVGKSILVAGLEVAIAAGEPFLDAEVLQGDVLHLDFDTDAALHGPWYRRVAAGLRIGSDVLRRIRYATPAGNGVPYLTPDRLQELHAEVSNAGPVAVIIDAWTSAFPHVRSNDAGDVAQVMAALREIARSGPAVVVLDHTPKPSAGAPAATERGLIGSTIKQAGARAVHLLQRVAPAEVQGRDIQALHTLKNNLAPLTDAIGIERLWHDGGVAFTVTDLPEGENRAPALARAMRVIRETVQPGAITARRALLAEAVDRGNVSERTAASALAKLVSLRELEKTALDGREVAYRLRGADIPAESLHRCTDRDLCDEQREKSMQTPLHDRLHFARIGDDGDAETPDHSEDTWEEVL
jgi:hypothetical protein